jgi:hypothetical protein
MIRGIIILLYTITLGVMWWDLLHGNVRWAWVTLTLGLMLIFMRIIFGSSKSQKLIHFLKPHTH